MSDRLKETRTERPVRYERIQSEQEGFRLALMGDAVSVAASAVFFAVRLVDATFDLFVSSALYSQSLEASQNAAAKYQTFLQFKGSEELRSMAFSLVLPLLLMRVLGAMKDVYYSVGLGDGNTARKVLDITDAIVLSLTISFSALSIPPLEAWMGSINVSGKVFNHMVVLDAFDQLEIAHLIALAQAGLLMLVSLLKLSARLERSSARVLERAGDMDSLENMYLERVKQLEETNQTKTEGATTTTQEEKRDKPERHNVVDLALDSDSSETSSSSQANPTQEETLAADGTRNKQEADDEQHVAMDSEAFYKARGWRQVTVPPSDAGQVLKVGEGEGGEDKSTGMEILMGVGISVATFVAVNKLHDPLVRVLRS